MTSQNQSDEDTAWDLLSEAGLIDIPADAFTERVTEAKHAVMERLDELMELSSHPRERDSAAYSLATLKKLEITLKQK